MPILANSVPGRPAPHVGRLDDPARGAVDAARRGAAAARFDRPSGFGVRRGATGSTVHGFTLFEIAVSLGLISLAVVSTLMMFPAGIKAQQLARFRVYAAAKMIDMADLFAAPTQGNACLDNEAPNAWDVSTGYRGRTADLESVVPSHRSGVAPLPLEIAWRIDSDNDEIAHILSEGGYLYYAHPQITANFDENALPIASASEAQRLVFAVTGYAQQNALLALPWKSWPYYTPYPSPPVHVHHDADFYPAFSPASPARADFFGVLESSGMKCYLWEATDDPDLQVVFQWPMPVDNVLDHNYGYMQYAYPRKNNYKLPDGEAREDEPTKDGALRYVQAALWYCASKTGYDNQYWLGKTVQTDFQAGVDKAVQARVLRVMSHAATCLTRWCDHTELTGAGIQIPVPAATFPTTSAYPGVETFTEENIVNLHESCLRIGGLLAASQPYDWGTPRPANRAIMMDYPLIQWDVLGPKANGTITGEGSAAEQWKPIAGSHVVNAGRSYSYPGLSLEDDGSPGSIWATTNERFSVTAPFAPYERCRQVVFWAADWQAFDDFETVPSAPIDASRYPKSAPRKRGALDDLPQMMLGLDFTIGEMWNYLNPERGYSFYSNGTDPRTLPTGTTMSPYLLRMFDTNWGTTRPPDQGYGPAATATSPPHQFLGEYGADRNFNGVLDRGPLPASARVRATLVARFNYYDPRVHQCLR